eukprot:6989131-Lingulodinium_polyedra.AAC.1
MAREPPSNAISDGVPAPVVPRLPEAPVGTVTSSPAAIARRGSSMRRNPRHSARRAQCQSHAACS